MSEQHEAKKCDTEFRSQSRQPSPVFPSMSYGDRFCPALTLPRLGTRRASYTEFSNACGIDPSVLLAYDAGSIGVSSSDECHTVK